MFLILGTELMGTHIELDSSREEEDSSILSSSSLRRESDTRDSEDDTSVQPLKSIYRINVRVIWELILFCYPRYRKRLPPPR